MKKIIFGITIVVITATACNSNTSSEKNKTGDTTLASNSAKEDGKKDTVVSPDSPLKEIVNKYLQMKNAFAVDNAKDAAITGKDLEALVDKMDTTSLTAEKKKVWNDLSDDVKEHAEHIGKNGDNIKHQREHFDMLSTDMYDMVKALGAGEVLYKEFCPMANEGLGAYWLSETKKIQNPYLGKKMPTCGVVKEEIK